MTTKNKYEVEVNGWVATFEAKTEKSAKMKAVIAYWNAYGKNGWPDVKITRRPHQ